jgi:hypothetical protein
LYLNEFDSVIINKFYSLDNLFSISGDDNSKETLNDTDNSNNNVPSHLSKPTKQQSSLPSDSEPSSDDEYSTIDTPGHIQQQQPITIADSLV